MFRFHFWEPIQYYDPTIKQPQNGWKTGHFLGFAWTAGDHLTYFVETNKASGRDTVLTRSLVCPVPTKIDNNNNEILNNNQMNTDSREEIAFNINNNDNNVNDNNNNNNTNINNNIDNYESESNGQETGNNNNIKNNDNTNNNERTTEDQQLFSYDELETEIEYDDDGLKTFDDSDEYLQDDQLVDENVE